MTEEPKVTAEVLDKGHCAVEFAGERKRLTSSKIAKGDEVTPVHMFLSGLLACVLMNADAALREENIDAEVTGEAIGERDFDRGAITDIRIKIRVKLRDDTDPEEAKKIAERGADRCIISRTLGHAIVHKEVIVESE